MNKQAVLTIAAGSYQKGVAYRFTAYALNQNGESLVSPSYAFTPRVPGPPTINTVTAAGGALNIAVSPPVDIGTAGVHCVPPDAMSCSNCNLRQGHGGSLNDCDMTRLQPASQATTLSASPQAVEQTSPSLAPEHPVLATR